MTEQEAINILNGIDEVRGDLPEDGNDVEIALMMAKDALEEVQQYRALGTAEELREAKKQLDAAKEDIRKLLCAEYGSSCQFCIHDNNEEAICCNVGGSGSWCCENAKWKSHRLE